MFITPDFIEAISFIGAVAVVYVATLMIQKKIAKLDEELAQDSIVINHNEQKNAA